MEGRGKPPGPMCGGRGRGVTEGTDSADWAVGGGVDESDGEAGGGGGGGGEERAKGRPPMPLCCRSAMAGGR